MGQIIHKRVVGAPKPACQRVFPLHLDVNLQPLRIGPQFQFYIAGNAGATDLYHKSEMIYPAL